MQRAVHLLIAAAAIIALIVGGALVLQQPPGFGTMLPTPVVHGLRLQHNGSRANPLRKPSRRRSGRTHKRSGSFADAFMRHAPTYLGLAGWLGLLAVGLTTAVTVDRRLRNRLIRRYERYEVKLSMHDDAKPGDLEDMIEAIGAAVRKRYNDRVSQGQPFIALELWHRWSAVGLQWTLCLVCEAEVARGLEGIIAGAYPDVRVGHEFDEEPKPMPAQVPEPGYVMRFRKRRPFVYPLANPTSAVASRSGKPTPLIEAIAMMQTSLRVGSVVRFQIVPTSEQLEDRARRRLERHERGHAQHHDRERSALERAELRSAVEVRQRSMFYLEVEVGSSDWETCNRVAASLVARRGENHLHRRYMVLRQRLYRRRFPSAYPPLLPPASLRNLVSGAELAHLLELPSARMKGVPVRRLTIPRMPSPPDAFRATDPDAPPAPTTAEAAVLGSAR